MGWLGINDAPAKKGWSLKKFKERRATKMVLEKSAVNSGKGATTPVRRTERRIVLKRCIVSLFWSVFCSPLCRNVTFVGCINKSQAVVGCCIDCGVCLCAKILSLQPAVSVFTRLVCVAACLNQLKEKYKTAFVQQLKEKYKTALVQQLKKSIRLPLCSS